MATAINAMKNSAITIAVQKVIGSSNIKNCILRYATIYDVFYNKIKEQKKTGDGNCIPCMWRYPSKPRFLYK